jgi:hypothetical protein
MPCGGPIANAVKGRSFVAFLLLPLLDLGKLGVTKGSEEPG